MPRNISQSTYARTNKIIATYEAPASSGAVAAAAAATAPLTPLKDAYEFNLSFNWVDPSQSALPIHIQDLADAGTTLRGKPILHHGANVPGTVRWQLDAGVQQDVSDGVITYTFATWNHGVGISNSPFFYQGQGYAPFTEAQKVAARIAVQNWDDLIAPTFVEIPAGPGASVFGQNTADIVMANTFTGPDQAEAYYPGLTPYFGKKYQRVEGDIWVADPRFNSSNDDFLPGQYGLQTLNHELGHSLGLSHPGSYNFGDDTDGDGVPDPINYTGDAFYFQDSHQFSIMSYFDAYETGGASIDWNVMRFIYPSTPMVDDVFVIQQKYGADMTTRTGDTTYGWNASSDLTNEAMIFRNGEMLTAFTIWDAGGEDTLDLSGYYTDSVIDLREGAYSSAGGSGAYSAALAGTQLTLAQINANNKALGLLDRSDFLYKAYFEGNAINPATGLLANEGLSWKDITGTGDDFLMENNIGIAYGAIIENAVGGNGDDRISGNHVDNVFTGGAGNDTFIIADHSRSVPLPSANGAEVLRADNSTDTITDFGNGDDTLDLSAFRANGVADVSDVSWDDASDTLTIDTNNNGVFDAGDVRVIIHGTFTTADIFFGA